MKTFIISMLLVLGTIGHAQQITVLDETRVGFEPIKTELTKDGKSFIFNVKENFAGEFSKDRLAFMKANFNITDFIASLEPGNYDGYQVMFKSSCGALEAKFDKEGKLLYTTQNFKNIVLPLNIMRDIYGSHKGWTVVKNKYYATTRGDIINKEIYRIKLKNGNRTDNLKIDGMVSNLGVVSN